MFTDSLEERGSFVPLEEFGLCRRGRQVLAAEARDGHVEDVLILESHLFEEGTELLADLVETAARPAGHIQLIDSLEARREMSKRNRSLFKYTFERKGRSTHHS